MVVGARRAGLRKKKKHFHAQPSFGFTENGTKNRKYPVSGSCVDGNALLMSGQRRMGRVVRDDRNATVTQIITRYNQGMQNTISEHTTRQTLKQMCYSSRRPHRVPFLYCCWTCSSLYDYSVPIFWCYFQQDNASCHKVKIISDWFLEHDNEFTLLKWPPQSPDLNPIEHLWDVVEREIRIMDVQPTNLQQLHDAIMSMWTKISENCFQHFVESMPWILKAVLKAKGGQTWY